MKLKNIFLVFVLGAIWGFSSCSSEEIIDTPQNGEATLSISLSVNDIETKAGEQIATSEELQISNCHIVVFDNEEGSTNGKFITSFDFSTGNGLSGDNNQYTCTAQKIRTFGNARKVKFLAIVNIDGVVNKLDDVSGKSYSEYLNAVAASSSFNSTNLVKVGEKSIELEKDKLYPVQIDLTQLTARFDFEGITGSSTPSKVTSEPIYEYRVLSESDWGKHKELKDYVFSLYENGTWYKNDDYYVFRSYYGYGEKRVIGIEITKNQSQSGYQFNSKKVHGLNKKTNIKAYSGNENSESDYSFEDEDFTKTFYSYKNASEDFKVTVVGRTLDQTSVFYGYIEQSRDFYNGWTPSLSDISRIYNNEGKAMDVKNIPDAEWIGKSTETGTQSQTFTLDLSNVQFENGYRYKIVGKYEPEIGAKITWEVVGLTPVDAVEIPSFN